MPFLYDSPMSAQDQDSDQRILHLLQLAAHRMRTHSDRKGLEAAGVTTAQAGALFVIAGKPGATQKEIAEALQQRESAVTGMITRLLDAKLVERRPSATDNRAWSLHLTAKGGKALGTLRLVLDELNARINEALGEDGVKQFAAALRAIGGMKL